MKYCLLYVIVISLNDKLASAMVTCIISTGDQLSQHSSKLGEGLMRLHQYLRCPWQLMISEGDSDRFDGIYPLVCFPCTRGQSHSHVHVVGSIKSSEVYKPQSKRDEDERGKYCGDLRK